MCGIKAILAVHLLSLQACGAQPGSAVHPEPATEAPSEKREDTAVLLKVLDESQDPAVLVETCRKLCGTDDPDALKLLMERLLKALPRKLDSDDDYKYTRKGLKIDMVLLEIARSGKKEAERVLLNLWDDPVFSKETVRELSVMHALGEFSDLSNDALQRLRERLRPTTGLANPAAHALARSGSGGACAILRDAFRSDVFPISQKRGWIVLDLIQSRHKPEVVGLFRYMIEGGAGNPEIAKIAVEALFDYRPGEWYPTSHYQYPPPSWNMASGETLRMVIDCVGSAERLEVRKEVREAVQRTRGEIEGILRQRAIEEKRGGSKRDEGGDPRGEEPGRPVQKPSPDPKPPGDNGEMRPDEVKR